MREAFKKQADMLKEMITTTRTTIGKNDRKTWRRASPSTHEDTGGADEETIKTPDFEDEAVPILLE